MNSILFLLHMNYFFWTNDHFLALLQGRRSSGGSTGPDDGIRLARFFVLLPIRIRDRAMTTGEARTNPTLRRSLRVRKLTGVDRRRSQRGRRTTPLGIRSSRQEDGAARFRRFCTPAVFLSSALRLSHENGLGLGFNCQLTETPAFTLGRPTLLPSQRFGVRVVDARGPPKNVWQDADARRLVSSLKRFRSERMKINQKCCFFKRNNHVVTYDIVIDINWRTSKQF